MYTFMMILIIMTNLFGQNIQNIELFDEVCKKKYGGNKETEELLDKFILLNPTHKEALMLKSYFRLYDFNDIKGAISILESAIKICDDKTGLYYNLYNIYELHLKDYNSAIKYISMEINNYKSEYGHDCIFFSFDISNLLQNRASLKRKIDQYDGAITDCIEALKYNKTIGLYYDIAINYESKGDVDKALDYYNKAADQFYHEYTIDGYINIINERSKTGFTWAGIIIDVLENRASLLFNKKQYLKAANDLEVALKLDKGNAIYHFKLGKYLYNAGKYFEAITAFENSLKINPEQQEAHFYTGFSEDKLGDKLKAVKCYSKAIEIDNNYKVAYLNRAILKEELKDYPGAIEDYTKAIELDPNNSGIYTNRGNVKFNINDDIGAILDYNEAIKLKQNNSNAYHNRGFAKERLQDYRGALADYTKAIQINATDSDSYSKRGRVKGKLKDFKGALSDYNIAIQLKPDDSNTYYGRAIIKSSIKDINGACLDWSKAGELGKAEAYDMIKKYCN